MDLDAPPLMEALSPVAELLDGVGVGNMRVKWWKKVILNANWKMAQEAFFEGYHVMQTHPQLLMGGGRRGRRFLAAGNRVHGLQERPRPLPERYLMGRQIRRRPDSSSPTPGCWRMVRTR